MIQRIQTVWLLLAGFAAMATLKLPSYANAEQVNLQYAELNGLNAGLPVLIVTITVAVLAFITIGLYKNRTTQLRLCVTGILLEACLIFLYYQHTTAFANGTPSVYSILHMCIVLFFVLAARGINKDEKLIKDSDRLR